MISLAVLASRRELPPDQRIWGTGGWVMPRERQALDWITLGILMGWDPVVVYADEPVPEDVLLNTRILVIATDPSALPNTTVSSLQDALSKSPLTVIATAAPQGSPWAEWSGASSSENRAGAVSRQLRGLGVVITLGFHPSEARDAERSATRALRDLLVSASPVPVSWVDLSDTVILRMDDPGGSQNIYNQSWCYPKISPEGWNEIGAELRKRDAKLSIGYISGWVDDGAPERGTLWVDGHQPERAPGAVYPSRLVRYQDLAGHAPGRLHDYQAEHESLVHLMRMGLISPELHGYTHIHPDRSAWLASPDRYTSSRWFRELGAGPTEYLNGKPLEQHPLASGIAELQAGFGRTPTTLIAPGEEFTNASIEVALDLGIEIIGSYYLGIRWHNRICWCTHVCSPYLDEADSSWLESGLPVVGYFHDKEPAEEGVEWFRRQLGDWEACGATRFIDYATLAQEIQPTQRAGRN